MISATQHSSSKQMRPGNLASPWKISLNSARFTIDSTTQHHIRLSTGSNIYRRYKILAHQLQYKQLGGYLAKLALDIFESKNHLYKRK